MFGRANRGTLRGDPESPLRRLPVPIRNLAVLGVTAGLVAAALVPAAGQAATPKTTTNHTTLQRALDAAVNARVPGAVLVARHDGHTVRIAAGLADVKHRTRMHTSDRFRVGTVTKSFVATVALQLVGEGRLSLDDSVESWLPGAVPSGAAISVRQLLNMRSGLSDYLDDDTTVIDDLFSGDRLRHWSPDELVGIANGHGPKATPDTTWSYCSTCYVLLGQIIERATGHPLGDELRRRIFVPAGLRATSFDTQAQMAGRHQQGYERLDKGRLTDVTEIDPSYAWASGAIVSTADDVARFYNKLLAGRLLRPDLVAAMRTTGPMSKQLKGWGYGFGLISKPIGCGTVIGNEGGALGFTIYAYNSKDGSRQALVMMNAGDSTMEHEDNGELQDLLARAYCG
jgi:D-alanyl-D-alanine carboxypeptidase